jgi:hypothetical protein
MECAVLPNIANTPPARIDIRTWNIPKDIILADETFNVPGNIDLLIGADIFFEIINPKKRTRQGNYPVLQETALGWIISGRTPADVCDSQRTLQNRCSNNPGYDLNYFLYKESTEQTSKQTKQSNGITRIQRPSKMESQQQKETSDCLPTSTAKQRVFTTKTQLTDAGNAKPNKDIPHHEPTCKNSAGNRTTDNQEDPSARWKRVPTQSNHVDVTQKGK